MPEPNSFLQTPEEVASRMRFINGQRETFLSYFPKLGELAPLTVELVQRQHEMKVNEILAEIHDRHKGHLDSVTTELSMRVIQHYGPQFASTLVSVPA